MKISIKISEQLHNSAYKCAQKQGCEVGEVIEKWAILGSQFPSLLRAICPDNRNWGSEADMDELFEYVSSKEGIASYIALVESNATSSS